MNIEGKTLQERILFIFLENNEWDADSVTWQVNREAAAKEIEKLILSEEIAILEDIQNNANSNAEYSTYEITEIKIRELTNKLNELK